MVADQAVFDNISAPDAPDNSLDHNFTRGAKKDVRHHRQVTEKSNNQGLEIPTCIIPDNRNDRQDLRRTAPFGPGLKKRANQ